MISYEPDELSLSRRLDFNSTGNSGTAQTASGQTINTFLGSVGAAAGVFAAQFLVFYLLRLKLTRI
jgi:hypothetical protein